MIEMAIFLPILCGAVIVYAIINIVGGIVGSHLDE